MKWQFNEYMIVRITHLRYPRDGLPVYMHAIIAPGRGMEHSAQCDIEEPIYKVYLVDYDAVNNKYKVIGTKGWYYEEELKPLVIQDFVFAKQMVQDYLLDPALFPLTAKWIKEKRRRNNMRQKFRMFTFVHVCKEMPPPYGLL